MCLANFRIVNIRGANTFLFSMFSVCGDFSKVAIYCHECKKVFELLEASAACPHCRYSVLPATKMPDGQEYVVKLPASAEAVKKRLR